MGKVHHGLFPIWPRKQLCMGSICQPVAHRCFGVTLHFGIGIAPGVGHNFMRRRPSLGQSAHTSLAQAMRGTLGQARLVAPVPHEVAKAIGRTALAVSGGKEGPIRKAIRRIGVSRDAGKNPNGLCGLLATILKPPDLHVDRPELDPLRASMLIGSHQCNRSDVPLPAAGTESAVGWPVCHRGLYGGRLAAYRHPMRC